MASTIETTIDSDPSVETEASPEPARTSPGRRVAIWAMAAAAVAGVGALSVAVVGYADDSSPNRPAPAVVEPQHSELQDPLMMRYGRDDAFVNDPELRRYPLGGPSITRYVK
jgi:hypothetical protein